MGHSIHHESGYALVLVLFILLVIIGAAWMCC
ncbi:YjcZ family sporulation protein [Mycoplasmatota bacterium]|nr:YjcZ family sporulation protein [Mycoplasmatota bacterium]